jgi:hypothetical protein
MKLAEQLQLPCGAILPNRIAKAAMTEGLADIHGRPTAELEKLYGLWSDGGAGLYLSGNIQIDADHLERPGNVIIDSMPDARQLDGSGNAKRQSFLGTNQSRGAADNEGRQPATKSTIGGQAGLAGWPVRDAGAADRRGNIEPDKPLWPSCQNLSGYRLYGRADPRRAWLSNLAIPQPTV